MGDGGGRWEEGQVVVEEGRKEEWGTGWVRVGARAVAKRRSVCERARRKWGESVSAERGRREDGARPPENPQHKTQKNKYKKQKNNTKKQQNKTTTQNKKTKKQKNTTKQHRTSQNKKTKKQTKQKTTNKKSNLHSFQTVNLPES